jgi:hypothetical protein
MKLPVDSFVYLYTEINKSGCLENHTKRLMVAYFTRRDPMQNPATHQAG